jgi:hypothetical protein
MEQFKKDQDSNKVNNSRFFFVPDELDNVSPDLNMSIFVLYPASAAEPIGW